MTHSLSRLLALFAACLAPAAGAGTFLAFTPDRSQESALLSVAGCAPDPGLATGSLGAAPDAGIWICHTGAWGAPSTDLGAFAGGRDLTRTSAEFLTPPLAQELQVGGRAELVFYHAWYTDLVSVAGQDVMTPVHYEIIEMTRHGEPVTIAEGDLYNPTTWMNTPSREAVTLDVRAYIVPAGSRLGVRIGNLRGASGRLLYGGVSASEQVSYADAGLTLFGVQPAEPEPPAEEPPPPAEEPPPPTEEPPPPAEEPPPAAEEPPPAAEEPPPAAEEPPPAPVPPPAPTTPANDAGTDDRSVSSGGGGATSLALLVPLALAALRRRALVALALLLALSHGPAVAGGTFLAFTPHRAQETALLTAAGCVPDAGLASGMLVAAPQPGICHTGIWGAPSTGLVVFGFERDLTRASAEFLTAPLASALNVGGRAELVFYHAWYSEQGAVLGQGVMSPVHYEIIEMTRHGEPVTIASGDLGNFIAWLHMPTREAVVLDVPSHVIRAGSRLGVRIANLRGPFGRLLYGGTSASEEVSYADAGLTLHSAHASAEPLEPPAEPPVSVEPPPAEEPPPTAEELPPTSSGEAPPASASSQGGGGAMTLALIVPLVLAALRAFARAGWRFMVNASLFACALAALGATALLGPQAGPREAERAERRGDLGQVSIDPDWARQLAARPRDPAGLTGSGITSVAHAADGSAASQAGAYGSRLFRTGYVGVEPTLGVTGNGWIFYSAIVTTEASGLDSVVIRSKDGGATWEPASPPRPTQDPYLWVDPTTDRIFRTDFAGCGLVSYSDDYGATWTDVPPVGCGHNTDHQTIYAGPPVTSTTAGYPNIIYYCAAGGGSLNVGSTMTTCSRSLDGGQTFLPTLTPPFVPAADADAVAGLPGHCGGLSGHLFVAADGAVYVPRGICGQPWLAISRDEGNTWTRVQVAQTGMARDAYGAWEHEAAVRADAHGNVFYSWVAHDRIPYLAVSRDGGKTFAAPIRIAPPAVKEANLPNMDMDEAGRLVFSYMGSTNSPGAPFPTEMYCRNQVCPGYNVAAAPYLDVTWNAYITLLAEPLKARPLLETVTSNDPADPLIRGECGPFRCQAEYDFIDVEFGPTGQIVAAAIDGCVPGEACTDPGEAVLGVMMKGVAATPAAPQSRFVASGSLTYAFVPVAARASGADSPEGCAMETGAAMGTLGAAPPLGRCHSAATGTITAYSLPPAEFTSAPLAAPLTIGGPTRLIFHVVDVDNEPEFFSAYPYYLVHAVPAEGDAVLLDEGFAATVAHEGRNEVSFELPPLSVPAGSRLRFSFKVEGDRTAGARILFGGGPYGDAGITLTVGRLVAASDEKSPAASSESGEMVAAAPAAGSLGGALLMPLLVLLALRHRPRSPTAIPGRAGRG